MSSSPSSSDDTLLSPSAGLSLLKIVDDDKLKALADVSTFIGTSDGPVTSKTVAAILGETSVQISQDKSINKALEVSLAVTPRSTWAFNNGPEGNYAHISWKTGDAPKGVTIESNTGSYEVEMAMSGQPATQAVFDFAKSAHAAIDARFAAHAKEVGIEKRASSNGPTSTMFVSARCSVFLPSAIPLDEGRTSEFQANNSLLKTLGNADLKWNRVPAVKIYDYRTRGFKEISWHEVHCLGSGVIINATMSPRAYLNGKKELVWEFRLIELDVVAKKAEDILSSPAKYSVKRRAAVLDLTDTESDGGAAGDSPSKPPRGAASASASKRPRGASSASASVPVAGSDSGGSDSDDEGGPANGTSATGAVAGSGSGVSGGGGGGSGPVVGAALRLSEQLGRS
ncbi:hypothetical protein GGX14DRAFT_387425 [Mycena pura]|uniref:Uncharacterized protein n=1 Tax=Mycena pura TaxID=153505 RepID=A0AAD6YLR0_9AGAR|nr:hypothetical protein GGX14DRAFT_387425 [Mycena pura]